MSDAWDADDFEPDNFGKVEGDKWEGEDEDDVKDNWEDDDDDSKKEEEKTGEPVVKAYQKKKKKLMDRIAEKQAQKAQAQAEEAKQLTPEEELSEKLRREKIQKEADLKLAKEAFGIEIKGIDSMYPETDEEYKQFEVALKTKISFFEKSKHYVPFLEKLFTDLVVSLEPDDVKKLGSSLTTIYHEKQKQQKDLEKKKKKSKKIVIKAERDTDFGDLAAAGRGDYNDYDDDEDYL